MAEGKIQNETILGRMARRMGIGRTTDSSEQKGIDAAKRRIQGQMTNSGGTIDIAGVGNTRESLDQTATSTAGGKANNESSTVTGA